MLKIKSLLVSQPAPTNIEKSPFNEIAAKYAVTVDFYPFIKVEGVSLKEYRSQRVEILDYSAVVFTSRTTVDHFFRICEQARIIVPETMKYLCNTEAVALYLQKYIVYRKRKIFFANGTFQDFMELILKQRDEKLLLILSEPYKPELPDTLRKLGIPFGKLILSRTVSNDLSKIDHSKYDMLAVYSHPEISALTHAFRTSELPLIAAFGEGTARAAMSAGLTVNVMAPTPEAPSMTKAIDLYLAQIATGKMVEPVSLPDNGRADEFIKAQEAKPAKKTRSRKPVQRSRPQANEFARGEEQGGKDFCRKATK